MSRNHLLIAINKVRDYEMSEAPVNIVKLAVGVQSVEELVLIQKGL